MLRKTFFWMHLCAGVLSGLVVLMMSATGVALTYERQMLAMADRSTVPEPAPGATRLGVSDLLRHLREQEPAFEPTAITFDASDNAPVVASAGRSGRRNLDPYTGEVLPDSAPGLRAFFDTMTGWHRWFNVEGDNRDMARAVTGACNLLFLFLVLSGIYIWLPPIYRWLAFRTRFWFNPKVNNSKARDYNWHHVFGIWSSMPLAVIVASAVVFSYSWANNLVYRSVGEEPPVRGRGGPPAERSAGRPDGTMATAHGPRLSLDALTSRAADHLDRWRSLTVQLPDTAATTVSFTLDSGTGGQPQHRYGLTLDAASGDVVAEEPFASQSAGRRARSWIRFLHTGEALGIAGQTVAGVVSLLTLLMVWTGLALAWRRLISPLFRRSNPTI